MSVDVTIIGGSFAGQAAALHLARTRRKVLLADAQNPRNRFAHASYGFLGQDGAVPSVIIAKATEQLRAYSTVEILHDYVVSAAPADEGFRIAFASGNEVLTKLIILAIGVTDELPTLAGLQERWGITVLHCPYCHGYELQQRPIGVLATGPAAFHQAILAQDWGPTTLFTQGNLELAADQRAALSKRGVSVETSQIVELMGNAPALKAVKLADGRMIEIAGLFVAPRMEVPQDLPKQLGCTFKEDLFGTSIAVDERQETLMRGVFAAGNAVNPMANATISAASGIMAASMAHYTLVFGDHKTKTCKRVKS